MKRIHLLSSIFFLFLMITITGCGSSDDDLTPDTGADTATFRVEYKQTGDFTKFIKIITIGGGDFTETGTDKAMPTVLSDSHLTTAATYSYEAKDVVELNINSLTGFRAVEDGPATMSMTFTVFRNNKQIDQKTFNYNEATDGTTEFLNYKAK